jgi:hypothetical protein
MGRDPELAGQLVERTGRGQPRRRLLARRVRADRAVAAQVLLVEHQPAREVRVAERRHVLGVEGAAEGVVVGRLVGEPPAPPVHHDRTRPGAVGVDHDAVHVVDARREVGDGTPPRLAHVAEHRAGEERRLEGPSSLRLPAGVLGVVVEEALGDVEVGAGLGVEETDHLGARLDVRAHQPLLQNVAGAARPRGGATHLVRLAATEAPCAAAVWPVRQLTRSGDRLSDRRRRRQAPVNLSNGAAKALPVRRRVALPDLPA